VEKPLGFLESIHLQTLVYVNGILVSIIFLAHLVLLMWNPSVPGLPLWVTGNLSLISGFVLLVLRSHLPMFLSIILANALVISGYYLIFLGIRMYMGKKIPSHKPFIVFMFFYLLYEGYFTYYSFSLIHRASISGLSAGIICFLISWEISKRLTTRSIPYMVFGGIFFLHGLFHCLRSFLLFYTPRDVPFFQGGGLAKLLFLEILVFIFAMTLGYIFLISARLVERLKHQAEIDHLTELFNTRALSKLAEKALATARRNSTILSVLILDIDHFKGINDNYGHAAGDRVLHNFASMLSEGIRPSDVVGRIGGEEFLILLPETVKEEALKVAERLRSTVEEMNFRHEGYSIYFTISIGITSTDGRNKSFDLIMREADTALYQAKREGRNRVVPYDGSDHIQRRLFHPL